MPNDQRQFRNLFTLFAQFHKSRLSRVSIHKLCDPSQHPPVLFAPIAITRASNHVGLGVHPVTAVAVTVVVVDVIVVAVIAVIVDC